MTGVHKKKKKKKKKIRQWQQKYSFEIAEILRAFI